MKILVLNWRDITHPKAGGAERVTMEHAKAWIKMGNSVTWVTAGYRGSTTKETTSGIQILRMGGSITVYAHAMKYLLMHGQSYDVIVDEFHGFPFFTPLLTRTPVVAFLHEIAGIIWDYTYPFPLNFIGKFIERTSFFFYRTVPFWVDAPSTANELTAMGIPSKNIYSIPCPIPGKIPEVRVVKEHELTCLFVSRLVPMKGIVDVLNAFSRIIAVHKKAKLWVIGRGDREYEEKIKRIIESKNLTSSVQLFGHVSEKEKFIRMAQAHVLLHASVKEGWGLVVLEAACMGTPAVVYNASGLRDVVKNGITGIVLGKNSPENLANETLLLFADTHRYKKFQKNGIAWVRTLEWEKVTNQSLELLKLVAKKNA